MLSAKQRGDPFRGPAPLAWQVDIGQRLEGERLAVRFRRTQGVMRAANREHRGTRGVALVEAIDLSMGVTTELERNKAPEHRIPGAVRSPVHHMAEIVVMGRKPAGGRDGGFREDRKILVEGQG